MVTRLASTIIVICFNVRRAIGHQVYIVHITMFVMKEETRTVLRHLKQSTWKVQRATARLRVNVQNARMVKCNVKSVKELDDSSVQDVEVIS